MRMWSHGPTGDHEMRNTLSFLRVFEVYTSPEWHVVTHQLAVRVLD